MTRVAAWCLRVAGANGIVNGLGFGGFTIPAMVSVGRGRGILDTFSNPTYGNGPFERIGVPTSMPLLWPRRSGIVVSIVGLLLCGPFWWGFDLPFAWLNAAVLSAFLVLAWTVRSTAQRGRPTSS